MSKIAIIPARGGSKRLPGKNLIDLGGKPLIAWTIEAAVASNVFDKVVVTTEDLAIAEVAELYGAEVPFIRPRELASDTAKSIDVVLHAIEALEESGEYFDHAILMQPTSPLRNANDIVQAVDYFEKRNADAVIAVTEMEHNPIWSNTLPEDNAMENFLPSEYKNARTQELPVFYRINGAFYMAKTELLKKHRTFFLDKNIYAYIMSQEHSVDIDTELDYILATTLLELRKKKHA